MNNQYCEKEQEVTAALAGSTRDVEILNHARECPVCSEVLLVREFLRAGAQLAPQEIENLPDATLIWRKAQVAALENALGRATLPIRAVRIIACAAGVFAAPLLVDQSRRLWPGLTDGWLRHLSSASPLWSSGSNELALLVAITGAVCLIGLSSWYMLLDA
jgi:hypothetical protein